MKILIIDDELVSRKKMEKVTENWGESVTVDSGKSAIIAYQQALSFNRPFDLITLDVDMPGMDGMEVLFEIRELERKFKVEEENRTKILMVTSHSDKGTVVTSIQAGCDAYIIKPFNRDTLLKKLMEMGVAHKIGTV